MRVWWLILECGHWYKWTARVKLTMRSDFQCPECGCLVNLLRICEDPHGQES